METDTFTGTADTDRLVISQVADNDLCQLLLTSKKFNNLCDINFWFNRFYETFGVNLKQYGEIDYKNLYKKLRKLNTEEIIYVAIENGYSTLVEETLKRIKDEDYKYYIVHKAFKLAVDVGNLEISILVDNMLPTIHNLSNIHPNYRRALEYAAHDGNLDLTAEPLLSAQNIWSEN